MFRFHPDSGTRSDRSAFDRQRHREKVRKAIKENIADIVAEEAIMGQSGGKTIKVPIRGIKEYRFIYGNNAPGVAQGDGKAERGQVVQRGTQGVGGLPDKAGDQPGEDYYETDVTIEEIIGIMLEDLELPDMERRKFAQVESLRQRKIQGVRRKGNPAHLDRRRTVKSRLRRRIAMGGALAGRHGDGGDVVREGRDGPGMPEGSKGGEGREGGRAEEEERFPFQKDDLRYRHVDVEEDPRSNAVVICIMDTSGSMDATKKYLARSFFFLLYQFVRTRYPNVALVFIAHTTEGKEVSEEEFFHKGESGGTCISSGYRKALEVIDERYNPALWNIYAFHCSDGDNFDSDNSDAFRAAAELCACCNLFGYGEIKPEGSSWPGSSMIERLAPLQERYGNFAVVSIRRKEEVWGQFQRLLSRDRRKEAP